MQRTYIAGNDQVNTRLPCPHHLPPNLRLPPLRLPPNIPLNLNLNPTPELFQPLNLLNLKTLIS